MAPVVGNNLGRNVLQSTRVFSPFLRKAVRFAIKTHEVYQKQKRKGKDIPYITHPLTVGLVLARAGAEEKVIAAGILHDTIEDSIPEKKVTREMLAERFGENVAALVESVTEPRKDLPWEERKQAALERIKGLSHDSLLVKSADIISNASEIVDDYQRDGDAVFERFKAPKEQWLKHHLRTITAVIQRWPQNPLAEDVRDVCRSLRSAGAAQFMPRHPAQIVEYADYDENRPLECPICGWTGTPKESDGIEYSDDLSDVSCPNCEKMLLVVSYPLVAK